MHVLGEPAAGHDGPVRAVRPCRGHVRQPCRAPQGEQGEVEEFRCNLPMPTNLNIVLAKLQPGQEIDVEMYAVFPVCIK